MRQYDARALLDQIDPAATRIKNRDAVAVIMGFRRRALLTRPGAFALWYQWAALAYGWDPETSDRLRTGSRQADAFYPVQAACDLWRELYGLADAGGRVELDRSDFDDLLVRAAVQDSLRADGAAALIVGDIPTPMCKEPGGKVRPRRPACDDKGQGPVIGINPITGQPIRAECDKPGDCEPINLPGPPDLLALALWIGLAYVVWQEIKPANAPVIRLEKRLARLERRRRK